MKALNCPFCGGKPDVMADKKGRKSVSCSNVKCPVSLAWFYKEQWNERHNQEKS